jgi:ribonucleoside-triphosphate reductase
MPITNCCLINLEDMLQNGTVISGTLIEKPHSFRTACTIVTQIITQVASSQYGGNSINLAHLAPFVDISRKKIRKEVLEELEDAVASELFVDQHSDEWVERVVDRRLRAEVADGIQTIQYQLITMSTTNG